MAYSMRRLAKPLLIILGIIVIVALLGEVYLFFRTAQHLPEKGTEIEFTSTGSPMRFSFSGSALSPVLGIAQFEEGTVAIQDTAPTLVSGELIALVRRAGNPGVVFGILHADTRFAALSEDTSEKSDLVVHDAVAAFSRLSYRPTTPGSLLPPEPVHEIVVVDISTHGYPAQVVGEGRSPRFMADGSLLVLSSEGVIRIDLSTRKRSVVIPRYGANSAGSVMNADASQIALADPSRRAVAFYTSDSQVSPLYAFQGMILGILPLDAAFTEDGSYLVRISQNSALLYSVPAADNPIGRQVAFFKIVNR